jgi:hypothetical protein
MRIIELGLRFHFYTLAKNRSFGQSSKTLCADIEPVSREAVPEKRPKNGRQENT